MGLSDLQKPRGYAVTPGTLAWCQKKGSKGGRPSTGSSPSECLLSVYSDFPKLKGRCPKAVPRLLQGNFTSTALPCVNQRREVETDNIHPSLIPSMLTPAAPKPATEALARWPAHCGDSGAKCASLTAPFAGWLRDKHPKFSETCSRQASGCSGPFLCFE